MKPIVQTRATRNHSTVINNYRLPFDQFRTPRVAISSLRQSLHVSLKPPKSANTLIPSLAIYTDLHVQCSCSISSSNLQDAIIGMDSLGLRSAFTLSTPIVSANHQSAKSSYNRLPTLAHGITAKPKNNTTCIMVSEFMTRKEDLHVLKPSTPVGEALRALVEEGLSGFPVIDEEWNLVGIVTDYDLLALASLPGGDTDTNMFPDIHSSWKTFREKQKLLCKTNGQVVSDVMTSTPLTLHETTSLGDATRLMLESKHVRLPIVDGNGLLVGIITREDVVRAAHQLRSISKKLP